MDIRPFFISLGFAIGSGGFAVADDAERAASGDEQVAKLDAITRRMASYLASLPEYRLEASLQWKLNGEQKHVGKLVLAARHSGEFRLEATSQTEPRTSLVCVGDGNSITRTLTYDGQTVYSQCQGDSSDLLEDLLTETSLRHSGLDLLCQADPRGHILVSASNVRYLGVQGLQDTPAHVFRMDWGEGSGYERELWLGAGEEPLLLKSLCSVKFSPLPDREFTVEVTANFDWTKPDSLPGDLFLPQVPSHAARVVDLSSYLTEGEVASRIGKPAPAAPLKLLNGADWMLSAHKGRHIVVLFFFTTWAAPSADMMPDLLDAIRQHESRGVVFYAVNVGEESKVVRTFVEARDYSRPVVLDPRRELARLYGVTAAPTAVIIDKQGVVQAAHVGDTEEIRKYIRQDLLDLLAGKSLLSSEKK
jgi:peroxiredoxin